MIIIAWFFLFFITTTHAMEKTHVIEMNDLIKYESKETQTDFDEDVTNKTKTLNVTTALTATKEHCCKIIPTIIKEIIDDFPELITGAGTAFGFQQLASFILSQVGKLNSTTYAYPSYQEPVIALLIFLPAFIVDTLYIIVKNIVKYRSTNRNIDQSLHKNLRLALLAFTTTQSQQTCAALIQSADELVRYIFSLAAGNKNVILAASFLGAGSHLIPIAHYPHSLFQGKESLRVRITSQRVIKNIVVLIQFLVMGSIFVISTLGSTITTDNTISIADVLRGSLSCVLGPILGLLTTTIVQTNTGIAGKIKNTLYSLAQKAIDCCKKCW